MQPKCFGGFLRGLTKTVLSQLLSLATVVMFATPGVAQNYKILHNFDKKDGVFPRTGVTLDAAGNVFGVSNIGGAYGFGDVYRISPPSNEFFAIDFSSPKNGGGPHGPLAIDGAGNLFGASPGGGEGCGTVFEWKAGETTLHFIPLPATAGCHPYSNVVIDKAGNLFGTVVEAGANKDGGIFELSAGGKFSLVYSFNAAVDGTQTNGLAIDNAGNVYGTNFSGGANGSGTLFALGTNGTFRIIHAFSGGYDGQAPDSIVTIDSQGNIYGTTSGGGNSCGLIYKFDKTGAETVLYAFDCVIGNGPEGPFTFDAQGNLYGTVVGRGAYGAGTIFKLDPSGNLTVIHNFGYYPDGYTPYTGLVQDQTGNFYGTTSLGGTGICGQEYYGCGVVFEITP